MSDGFLKKPRMPVSLCLNAITETSPFKSDPRFPPTYSKKREKSGVGIKMIKMDNFQYFSIKSYVVDVY